jgi:hypothetical protein
MIMDPESGKQPQQSAAYTYELDAILNVPLVPERIDGYARDALGKLVLLVEKVTIDYGNEADFQTKREWEDAALVHLGLPHMEPVQLQ